MRDAIRPVVYRESRELLLLLSLPASFEDNTTMRVSLYRYMFLHAFILSYVYGTGRSTGTGTKATLDSILASRVGGVHCSPVAFLCGYDDAIADWIPR